MTPAQQECLGIINELNAKEFGGWFQRSSVMAFIQIESAFRPHAYRHEPAGVASYGYMQVLDITARGLGLIGSPEQMYTPRIGILYGMKCARQTWDIVMKRMGHMHEPTVTADMLRQWADAYNRGPLGAALGSSDHAYVHLWWSARGFWLHLDGAIV